MRIQLIPTKKEVDKAKLIFNKWNEVAKLCGFPTAQILNDSRRSHINGRLTSFPKKETWDQLFDILSQSSFLSLERWFNLDYVIRSDSSMEKVLNRWMDWKKKESVGYNGTNEERKQVMKRTKGTVKL